MVTAAAAISLLAVRGRLHVSDSVYESPYDSVHGLHTKGLGYLFSLINPLITTVCKKKKNLEKSIPNSIAIHLWQEIVHPIARRIARRITCVWFRLSLIIPRTPITTACQHISGKIN
jgi:hypothetical protein